MIYYYGTKNNNDYGFYLDKDNFTNNKYSEVSETEHDLLINQASLSNKEIHPNSEGYPELTEPPVIIQEEYQEEINELENYLKSTDWYAIRYADTNEAIPDDVKLKRQNARERISELKELL